MQGSILEQVLNSLDEKYTHLTDFDRHIYQGGVLPPNVVIPPRARQLGAIDEMLRLSLLMRLISFLPTLGAKEADKIRLCITKWTQAVDEEEGAILKGIQELLPGA